MNRTAQFAFAILALAIAAGCSRAIEAIVYNATATSLTMSWFNTGNPDIVHKEALPPHVAKTIRIGVVQINFSDSTGRLIAEGRIPVIGKSAAKQYMELPAFGARKVYFVITEKGFFPIPLRFKNEWTNHLAEIEKESYEIGWPRQ